MEILLRLDCDLLVQDGEEDGDESERKQEKEDTFSSACKTCGPDQRQWRADEPNIRRDIETHLDDRIFVVSSALHILYRHGPVLAERSAEDSVIADLNDRQR